ncbi:MAG: hypothetical protein OEW14_15440, partial [Nitrospira sp.]|nr:hypothetical protein [Nitrospira sp.]MDH5319743.1 hypothetical protein [Nitrospira sp.]
RFWQKAWTSYAIDFPGHTSVSYKKPLPTGVGGKICYGMKQATPTAIKAGAWFSKFTNTRAYPLTRDSDAMDVLA